MSAPLVRQSGYHGRVEQTRNLSIYTEFSRDEWARLRDATPLTLTEADLERVRGINERISLDEVAAIYLPLSRLLNLYVGVTQDLHRATGAFVGRRLLRVPFVIGIAGSVAVGKSTTSRILRELLQRWPNHPRVALVATDGFLFPNRVLQERGLLERKGFPESYDVKRLLQFLADVKSGATEVAAPFYSHVRYDIVPEKQQWVRQPDIVILEGLNVLQTGSPAGDGPRVFVSDFFDFSIYVDADAHDIQRWYVDRFHTFRRTSFRQPESFFRHFADLSEEAATQMAEGIWVDINERNLRENILPTRNRARLILRKGPDHGVERVFLRKL